jgi:hypothetical protein
MGAPGIVRNQMGLLGLLSLNEGFTGLIVGARNLTHRIVLCKTFIYIYVQLFGPYDRTRDVG